MRNKNLFFFFFFVFIIGLVSCNTNKQSVQLAEQSEKVELKQEDKTDEIKPDEEEKLKFRIISLYFYSPYYDNLKVEKRQVFDLKEKTAMIKQVLRSLKLGPVSKLKPTVPDNIEFRDVFIYNDTVYIDLHKNNSHSVIGGVEGEELFVESVVKTVLSISPDYHRVKFLIDGEETPSVMGHIDCSKFFRLNSF